MLKWANYFRRINQSYSNSRVSKSFAGLYMTIISPPGPGWPDRLLMIKKAMCRWVSRPQLRHLAKITHPTAMNLVALEALKIYCPMGGGKIETGIINGTHLKPLTRRIETKKSIWPHLKPNPNKTFR